MSAAACRAFEVFQNQQAVEFLKCQRLINREIRWMGRQVYKVATPNWIIGWSRGKRGRFRR